MDIEEIKRLYESITNGDWMGGIPTVRMYGKNSANPIADNKFIAAAPQIAQKAIELDALLKEPSLKAHEYIAKHKPDHITVGDNILLGIIKDAEILREKNKALEALVDALQNVRKI